MNLEIQRLKNKIDGYLGRSNVDLSESKIRSLASKNTPESYNRL